MGSKKLSYYKKDCRQLCCMGVVLFLVLLISACKSELYSEVSEKEANEMMSVLRRSDIETDKIALKDNLYAIRVEQDQISRATDILSAYGYPRETFKNMGELFKKEGLVSSPLEERVRYIYALSQSLSETLMQIDGVITARVNIVLPENDPLAGDTKPSSASVFVKYHPESNLQDAKSDIKMIVEKSIEGLSYDKVSLVMLPGHSTPTTSAVETDKSGIGSTILWLLLICASIVGLLYAISSTKKRTEFSDTQPLGFPNGSKKTVIAQTSGEGNTDAAA